MNNPKHWYLFAYDIRCPRRLQRLHRFFRTQAYALQESVFVWHGNHTEMLLLQAKILTYIKLNEDDLRAYCLSPGSTIQCWGSDPFIDGIFDSGSPPIILESPHHA